MSSYCDIAPGKEFHDRYHAKEYGFPKRKDDELFERLVLEMNQAGLSWLTILKKHAAFQKAYDGFNVEKVAAYGAKDKARLLRDAGIIRNQLKIDAAIANAKVILQLRKSHGSFAAWLDAQHPLAKEEWVKLFKKTFRFTGGEITGEFLLSLGYLPGAHKPSCPVYAAVAKKSPPWMRSNRAIGRSGDGVIEKTRGGAR
jgi:DNA-3-methyladenine glycosylase I